MKRLIAQRPVLYMGRAYEQGDSLPAHDPKMVEAWLRAKSAAWSGQEGRQDTPDTGGGQEHAEVGTPANGGQNGHQNTPTGEGGQNTDEGGQNAAENDGNGDGGGALATVTGHLSAAKLETWKKADLEKLAAEMGVDISTAKNNAERAAILAAAQVQIQANLGEGGGASSNPDAGTPEA